ncbi:MAG: hypothetical protein AB7P03_12800 [Kofleriaceae bacterium]
MPDGSSSSRAADRVRQLVRAHGWLVAIAVAYLYVFPYFPKIRSANELPRIYLVKAIADDHGFAIDRGVARWGSTSDVSPSGGHSYSNKAPGSSMLAAPAYAIARAVAGEPRLSVTMWICRLVAGIVPALGFLWLLWGFLARFAPDPAVRRLVMVGYGLGSIAMVYAMLFFSHQLGAVCIASAWILATDVADKRRGVRAMAVAGALAGAAPLVDYQAVFAVLPIAVYMIVRWWGQPRREVLRLAAVAAIAAAIPIAILLAYHAVCFGSPWRTGYDASTSYAHFHQHGFLGITGPHWDWFAGAMVQQRTGLIVLMPWLLLAIPGGFVLARSGQRGIALVGASVAAIYVLFISSINFWHGGWGIGPRYITVMLPFVLPLVAAQLQALRDRPVMLGAASGLVVASVLVLTLAIATFPYWHENLGNPLYDLTFRLLGDNLVAPNLASAVGVAGIAGLLPYLALIACVVGFAIVRACGARGLGVALLVAAMVIAGYRAFPSRGNTERIYAFVRDAVASPGM